jgi:hypothetical protein
MVARGDEVRVRVGARTRRAALGWRNAGPVIGSAGG